MIIDLNNVKIEYIQKKPYCIFKINNFYTDEGFDSLLNNFPKIEYISNNQVTEYNNKYYFNSESNFYKKLIDENKVLNELHENVFDKNLMKKIFNNLFSNFIYARKWDIRILLRLFKLPYFNTNRLNKKDFFNILFNKVRPIIEFSYINNNGCVVPHTDNRNKLVSMLTYFPDQSVKKLSNKELGTKFWLSDVSNYENIHYKNEKEVKFINESKLIYNTPFDEKNLYGFIKNSHSWHSVSRLNIPENTSRKSINISFLIDN